MTAYNLYCSYSYQPIMDAISAVEDGRPNEDTAVAVSVAFVVVVIPIFRAITWLTDGALMHSWQAYLHISGDPRKAMFWQSWSAICMGVRSGWQGGEFVPVFWECLTQCTYHLSF